MHKLYHVRYFFDLGDISKCLNSSYLFKEGPPPLRFQSFHTFKELYDTVSSSSFSCCSAGKSLLYEEFVTFSCDEGHYTVTAKTFKAPVIIRAQHKECSTKDYNFDFFKKNLSMDDFVIFLREHNLIGGNT
jgi:hypothetical protein